MTSEFFQNIARTGAAVDLSGRTKLQLRGADRVRYLNGQVTNDVRKVLAGATAIRACVTNAKGRMEGDGFIHTPPDGGSLCLDAESILRESLHARLERYIVADDVELSDVSDELRLWHFFGKAAQSIQAMPPDGGGYFIQAMRMGEPGVDLWLGKDQPLPRFDAPLLSVEDMETIRIIRGVPRWPQELNGEVFPQEAGLETAAMDYFKGCYIGQEVLSRIKTTGKMPRILVKWEMREQWEHGMDHSTLTRLFIKSADGAVKEAGHVTSFCVHPLLDRGAGLGYVRQGLESAHSLLLAHAEEPMIHHEVNIIRI